MIRIASLRLKLGITNALLIAVVFASVGYIRHTTVTYRANRTFDRLLFEDARFLARRITSDPQLGFTWSGGTDEGAELVVMERLRPYILVTDMQGNPIRPDTYGQQIQRLLSSHLLDGILPATSGVQEINTEEGRGFRFISLPVRPRQGSEEELLLHVGRSTESLQLLIREYALVYFYSLPLIVAISGVVGWYLAGRAVRPFEEVARAAGKITSENLNTQISSSFSETEVKRLVTTFNGMVSRLNKSFEQMRKFNLDVAHELRTPLAILRGETEVALGHANLTEEIRAILDSNLEELDRLSELINQMLTLSEAEAGGQTLAKEPVNLGAVIEDLVEQMRPLAEYQGIGVDLGVCADLHVQADELWLRRALINVLDNAIKYSSKDDVIRIWCEKSVGRGHIFIQDEGIGISGEDLPHVFDRLYRADPARSRASGGLGLGLSLVRWVVEAHGGKVRLQSRLDEGTLCEIELPLIQAPSEMPAEVRIQS